MNDRTDTSCNDTTRSDERVTTTREDIEEMAAALDRQEAAGHGGYGGCPHSLSLFGEAAEMLRELGDRIEQMTGGIWTGADPRIITLRRERDEALASLAADAAEKDEAVGRYEMLREMTDSCPDCGGTGIEEVPERSHCCMCDGQGMVMLGTVADTLRDLRADRDAAVADRDRLAEAAHDLNEYASNKAGYWQHPLTEKVRAYFDALAGREGSNDA